MSGVEGYGSTTVGGAGYEHLGEGLVRTEGTPAAETIHTFDALNIPMTPAFILAMVGDQLRDMDRQMREEMLHINGRHSESAAIGEEIQALQELEGLLRDSRAMEDDGFKIEKLNDAEGEAVAEFLGINTEQEDDEIENTFRDVMERRYGINIEGGDEHLDVTQVKNAIDSLREDQRQINTGNELVMMRLQDAMQRRSQIIQAGSNFLASIHESSKTIIGNLR